MFLPSVGRTNLCTRYAREIDQNKSWIVVTVSKDCLSYMRLLLWYVPNNCSTFYEIYSKKKSGLSQKRPVDSGSYKLTKQESAGTFLGSIRRREIFQFEFWHSRNFVIIFSFIEKSMKNSEINTSDWCYILKFFSESFVYIPLQRWGFKAKKRDSEMSHLYETRLKKSSSTEFNENWLDS